MKKILLFTSFYILMLTSSVNSQTNLNILGAWGKEENNTKTLVIITDYIFSVASYNLVEKKFNYTWGGKYRIDKENIELSYEWHSQDSSMVNVSASNPIALKKNGQLSIGNMLSGLTRLDGGKAGDLFGSWIISGNYTNDIVSKRANPFFPRRTMKIISGKYFQWVSYNVVTKKFFDAGGGTQTTQNGKYTENIEYFTKTTESIGKSLSFGYTIIDGDWRHQGQKSTGGPLDECWTKRKIIEEKFTKK